MNIHISVTHYVYNYIYLLGNIGHKAADGALHLSVMNGGTEGTGTRDARQYTRYGLLPQKLTSTLANYHENNKFPSLDTGNYRKQHAHFNRPPLPPDVKEESSQQSAKWSNINVWGRSDESAYFG